MPTQTPALPLAQVVQPEQRAEGLQLRQLELGPRRGQPPPPGRPPRGPGPEASAHPLQTPSMKPCPFTFRV